jgi:hypothetical protein
VSLFGELFGYDSRGKDLLGYPERVEDACVVCGVASNAHTPEMEEECLSKLFGGRKAAPEERA